MGATLLALDSRSIARVGIDGVDGAGKTVLADELAAILVPSGRPIIRASVDGFHHPRSVRYRRGRDSPEGFFRDSYDYAALTAALLGPLRPGGDGVYRREIFDVDADRAVSAPPERAAAGSILLFDGIFLHRPELRAYWDFSIFLRVEWTRNHRARSEGGANPDDPHQRRYAEGQALYFRECRPWERASLVIDNHQLDAPFIVHHVEPLDGPAGWPPRHSRGGERGAGTSLRAAARRGVGQRRESIRSDPARRCWWDARAARSWACAGSTWTPTQESPGSGACATSTCCVRSAGSAWAAR